MELSKMKLTSASGSEINLEALYQICPSCFTEVKDEKTGELTHKINFNILRELLGDNAFEGADEEYGFNWVGKNAARREAARVITKTLRPCPEESVDWENTQNLYIEGDNLEVLKLLQKSYLGKIKMIYIDPPYNTGKDFVYRDDFAMDKDGYDRAAGNIDEMRNRFRKNLDSNARFHSDWCSMIYERLLVARALLSNDGVIFISIDDNEVENLRKICDEVFGEHNFVGNLVLKTATDNNPSQINIEHEYMICYAKNRVLQSNWTRISEAAQLIREQYMLLKAECVSNEEIQEKLRKWIKANKERLPQVAHYNNVDDKGVYSSSSNSSNPHPGGYMYDILHPATKLPVPKPANGWRWPETTFWAYANDGEVEWGKDESTQPHIKKRIETSQDYLRTIIYEDNRATTKNVADLFEGRKVFDNPKPTSVLKRVIDYVTNADSLILDFFSGSATTAHAVMQLNAEDGGNRRYIMVQLPEETEAGSEAYKAGYKNICEIGKERIRRAGKKIKEEGGLQAQNLDTGFRVFKCEDSFMNDVYFSPAELKQEDLFSQVENIKDGTSDLSMLFGCMLDWGVQLSLPLSNFTVSGKKVYNVNDGDLVACFAEDVNEDVISAIAELSPLRVVFRDSCFKEAAFKMNLFELFKQKCGWSEEQVKNRVHVI